MLLAHFVFAYLPNYLPRSSSIRAFTTPPSHTTISPPLFLAGPSCSSVKLFHLLLGPDGEGERSETHVPFMPGPAWGLHGTSDQGKKV